MDRSESEPDEPKVLIRSQQGKFKLKKITRSSIISVNGAKFQGPHQRLTPGDHIIYYQIRRAKKRSTAVVLSIMSSGQSQPVAKRSRTVESGSNESSVTDQMPTSLAEAEKEAKRPTYLCHPRPSHEPQSSGTSVAISELPG